MKKFILLTMILATAWQGWSQYDKDARKILDAVSDKYKDMSFTADFEFGLENKTAAVSENFVGSIAVSGDKYLANTKDGIVLNDGVDVYTFIPDGLEVNIATYYPEEEEIGFNNIFTVYKKGYKYALMEVQQNGSNVIELAPENPSTFSKIRMVVTPDISLEKFMIFNRNGNVFSYVIRNLRENVRFSEHHFELLTGANKDQVHYGGKLVTVEVIDFR